MLLELLVKDSADPRFYVNVFEGIGDPTDPNGDGFEINVFSAMNEAIYRLPAVGEEKQSETPWNRTAKKESTETLLDIVWRADTDAFKMMERQATSYGPGMLVPVEEVEHLKAHQISFRGIPIEIVDG